ncbi:MAG: TSUP family transporter, partial [Pseudomonadota bacterium]
MFDDATSLLAVLAIAAFLAGFVDSIAGGGGLITVPALVLAGLSPVEALGTN